MIVSAGTDIGGDDAIKRRYFRCYGEAPVGRGWSKEMVKQQIVDSFRALNASTSMPWPKKPGSGMPYATADDLEQWLDINVPEWRDNTSAEVERFTTEEITLMEDVIEWQRRYLADDPTQLRPHPCQVFAVWVGSHTRHGEATSAYKERGWDKKLYHRRLGQAMCLLAIGLMRDEVIPPAHLFEPEADPGTPMTWKEALESKPVEALAALLPVWEPPEWWPAVVALVDPDNMHPARSLLWQYLTSETLPLPGQTLIRDARFARMKRELVAHIPSVP